MFMRIFADEKIIFDKIMAFWTIKDNFQVRLQYWVASFRLGFNIG